MMNGFLWERGAQASLADMFAPASVSGGDNMTATHRPTLISRNSGANLSLFVQIVLLAARDVENISRKTNCAGGPSNLRLSTVSIQQKLTVHLVNFSTCKGRRLDD